MIPRLAGFIAIVLMFAGCAATQAARLAPAVDVTGDWHGVAYASGGSGAFSMSLRQTGADVTGDIAVVGSPQTSGPLQGTVSGDTFEYSAPGGAGATLTVRANEMFGLSRFGNNLYLKRQ